MIYSGQDFADTGKAFLIEHVDVFQEQHFHLQELPYLLHWLPKVDFGFTLTIKFKERMNCTRMNVSSLDSNAPVGKANISSTMCDKSILASGLIYTSVCAFIMVCLCVCVCVVLVVLLLIFPSTIAAALLIGAAALQPL